MADRVHTVLLDLDGTLTDSAPGIWAGFRHALAVVGAPPPTPEVLAGVIGPPLIDSFAAMNLGPERAARALAAYVGRYDDLGWAENSPYDGIADTLARLAERDLTLAVATSKNEGFARRIARHFELDTHFAFVAGASDDGTRRAKADVIERALRSVGVDPVPGATEGVVMIGARGHDVEGAAHWGIPTVAVRWGYGRPDEHAAARWAVDTPAELTRLLGSLTA